MLDLSLCSSHEGQSFAEVRRGLYEVQSKCFHSVNFLIKDAECGSRCSAQACLEVSGWGVEKYKGFVNVKKGKLFSK